jgi:hypothetical protein
MSKQFQELSKDLAQGVSRRKAFLRFGSGIGAVLLGMITRKRASADDDGIGAFCDQLCARNDDFGFRNHGQCVSDCVHRFKFNKTINP